MTVKIWYKIEELEETSINFEQNKTVDDLKKTIIKNEPSALKDCTSSEISLKITKDGDSKIHVVSPRWVIQKVLQEYGNDFLCLIQKNVKAIKTKTRKDDADSYFQTIGMLGVKPDFIPQKSNLLEWLQQPPINPIEIIPSLYEEYFEAKLPSEYLNKIFVSSEKASLQLWSKYITHIALPPDIGTTEDSYHALWDMLIVKPLKIGSPNGRHNRNTSLHTSTRKLRPDLSYLVQDACLARGEEKGLDTEGDPAEELTEKLIWTYGQCPYVFGYHARATTVTYCYLYLEGEQVLRRDLFTCDLNELAGRVQAFITGINIGRLLPLLRQTIPQYFQQEFVILHRSNGKVVELMQNVVVKRYCTTQPIIHIRAIYDSIKHKVPFTDRLEHVNDDEEKTPFVVLSPKGMVCRPQSKEQLIKSLCCVLNALKALHEMGIMHRDIRWENVLKYIDRDKWFIIDFDDACYISSPTSSVYLAKDSHAPEIFEDHHNESVDIWSVGYLILTATVNLQESDELKIYATSLMEKDVNDRPTAKVALEWLWNKYRDTLKEDFLEGEES